MPHENEQAGHNYAERHAGRQRVIAGLKSDVATVVCVACRALWIKKAIIAKYETIIASTNRNRRAPSLSAVTRNGAASVVLYKLTPCILLVCVAYFAFESIHARQRLVSPSNAFSR